LQGVNKVYRRWAINLAWRIGGLLCTALAYRMFLIPNDIAPGGFTGIGQILNHIFGVNIGLTTWLLNIPVYAFALKILGWKFCLTSLICSFALSMLIDYLPVPGITDDVFLSTVFGAILGGIGFGMILRGNGSTGGSDTFGAVIHARFPVKVSVVVAVVDSMVVIGSAVVFSLRLGLYALVCVFIMNFTMDFVLEGMNMARAYTIISQKSDIIANTIMREMQRGVTGLNGKGMYSGADTQVLLCVISRAEVMRLRKIVYGIDPRAFVIAVNANEVLGAGFKEENLPVKNTKE